MKKSKKVFILVSVSVIAAILAVMVVFALLHKNTESQNSETDFSVQSDVIVYEQPQTEEQNNDSMQSDNSVSTETLSAKLNIADYKIDNYKETDDGHYFCFVRYIGGYPSTDKYSIQIGFDGSVVYISDFTDTFDGKKIDYDKAFIDEKIKANTDESKVDWNSVNINLNDNKVTVFVTLTEDNAICAIPLE